MGSWNRHACSCGYECQVSGGEDVGMLVQTNTFCCNACQTVQDIATHTRSAKTKSGWRKLPVACPECKSKNLKPWTNEECPKCKGTMAVDTSYIVMWD